MDDECQGPTLSAPSYLSRLTLRCQLSMGMHVVPNINLAAALLRAEGRSAGASVFQLALSGAVRVLTATAALHPAFHDPTMLVPDPPCKVNAPARCLNLEPFSRRTGPVLTLEDMQKGRQMSGGRGCPKTCH